MFPRPQRPAALLALLLVAGCNRAFGPERMETTTLSGRVHIDGRPVTRGWVEFMPIEGTVGRLRSAALRPDGTFVAEKVPVGRVGIRLDGPPLPRTGDIEFDQYLGAIRHAHAIHRPVLAGPNPPLDIDLRRENDAYRAAMIPEPGR